jgi:hypothetical protein
MSLTAEVTKVQVGILEFDGLMLSDGRYAIAVPQIAEIFQFAINHASRDLKTLLGEGFQFAKLKTKLNPKAVNIVFLEDFKKIIRLLDKKGNPLAEALTDALLEEGLERRFARAFGVKLDEDELNEKLKLRMKRLLARHDWTDVLMERHVDLYGTKPEPTKYKQWTIKVNRKLFNQDHFCCNRDTMTSEQQKTIYDFESMAKRRAMQHPNISPDELVLKALDTF